MSAFFEPFIHTLVQVLAPLRSHFSSAAELQVFLARFGWDASVSPGTLAVIRTGFAIEPLLDAAEGVVAELEEPNVDELEVLGQAADALIIVVDRIRDLSANPPTGLPFPFDQQAFWDEVPPALFEYLLARYLQRVHPLVYGLFDLTGVVRTEPQDPTGTGRVPWQRVRVDWSVLGDLFTDPAGVFEDLYHWSDPSVPFDHERLLRALERVLLGLRFPVRRTVPRDDLLPVYYPSGPPDDVRELDVPFISGSLLDSSGFVEAGFALLPIRPAPASTDDPNGLMITPLLEASGGGVIPLTSSVSVELTGGFDAAGALRVELRPAGAVIETDLAQVSFDASVALIGHPDTPWILIGRADSHRVELGGFRAALRVGGNVDDVEVAVEAGTGTGADAPKLSVVVQMSDADSFLGSIIGTEPMVLDVSGMLTWSSKTGFAYSGTAGISFVIPMNLRIGTVEIISVLIALRAGTEGFEIAIGVTGTAAIGPIAGAVENIGLKALLTPVADDEPAGLLGNLDLGFGFLPPTGFGLTVDASGISGGGYLSFDNPNGRYAGILQLEIFAFSITAIGLLDTKFDEPNAPPFSFLIIISVKFPPIQLGYGFTLNGLGGLAGIHRTVVTQALQDGVRTGAVGHIMFPDDPVRNAPQIIADLRTIFPSRTNRFVFGPMAILGWGTPTLIEAEIGLILEVPDPITLILLGQLRTALPTKEAAVVFIQIDVLGILDFSRQLISIDASLRDSHVAGFPLTGDMAMRLSWGEQPNFALSVGGLHPAFEPPPNFPTLARLAIAIGNSDNPRLTLQAYFALTTNSLQFGARAEIYAEAAGFSVSGWVGFDALIIFVPFSFTADIGGGVALKRGNTRLAGVTLHATLTGPTPYHAWGKASLSTLFGDISVRFDATFGERAHTEIAPAAVWPQLETAIAEARNWSGSLGTGVRAVVGVTDPGVESAPVLIQPMGSITLRQKVVPLNYTIEKFGEAAPADATRFDVADVSLGDDSTDYTEIEDYFAPGHYEELTDSEKLSRASFEKMDAGVTIGDEVAAGESALTEVEYETRIIDTEFESRTASRFKLPLRIQLAQSRAGAAARSVLRNTGPGKFINPVRAPGFSLPDEEFGVATQDDLTLRGDLIAPGRFSDVNQALESHFASFPNDRGKLQIVALHELAGLP